MLIEIAKQSRSLAELTDIERKMNKEVLVDFDSGLRGRNMRQTEEDGASLSEVNGLNSAVQAQEATIAAQMQANKAQRVVVKSRAESLQ